MNCICVRAICFPIRRLILFGLLVLTCTTLWAQAKGKDAAFCMDEIMKGDAEFGKARNHDPESMPIHQAIATYVENIRSMDYSNCPTEFTKLFHAHIDAWQELVPHTEPFAELRGEMHDVFDQIEKRGNVGRI